MMRPNGTCEHKKASKLFFLSNYNILPTYVKIKLNKAYLKNNMNFFDYNKTITLQITVKNGNN
jgi:S-adenosylmethionine synthetase